MVSIEQEPLSLRRRSVQGALWSITAYGGGQGLRFINSMILTRLLAPEYFGLMALVNVLLIGMAMFSDIGVGPNIVQSERGSDRVFLNTAWTIQIIRGGAVWSLCLIFAWPFAWFYNDPRLTVLVCAAGFSSVISGFNSTKLLTAQREIDIGRLAILELGSQALTIVVTLIYAKFFPSVWALVFASLFGTLAKTVASHIYLPGSSNHFELDSRSIKELIHFGRWIFVGTIIGFFANSAASLILGKFLPLAEVGIFSLAVTLAKVISQAYDQVAYRVLFPVYAKIKHLPRSEIRPRILRVRMAVVGTFVPPLLIMSIWGQSVIDLLLDHRYHSGGWILQLFSAFALPSVVSATGPFYLALGNSFLSMALSAIRLAFYLLCASVGWFLAGSKGIIVGIAAHTLMDYLADLIVQYRYGIWMPWFDTLVWLIAGSCLLAGLYLTGQLG
jgi:O-antigen/teichoic acid export membrane protein